MSATLHPAFALRGMPQFLPDIKRVLARAKAGVQLDRPARLLLASDAEEVARSLDGCKAVALDVETPRDDHDRIVLVGIAPLQPWRFDAACLPWGEDAAFLAKSLMEDGKLVKVGHNFAFDQRAFRANGIEPAYPVYDTIQAAARLWPPQPRSKQSAGKGDVRWLALAACVMRACEGVAYWKEPDRAETRAFYEAAWPDVPAWQHARLYCALDAYYTGKLWQVEEALLKRWGMWELFSEIVAPAGFVLSRLEARGLLLDEETQGWLRTEAEALIDDRTSKVDAIVGELHGARVKRIEEAIGRLEAQQAEVTAQAQALIQGVESAHFVLQCVSGDMDSVPEGGAA